MRDFIYLQIVFCASTCSIRVDTSVYRNLASQLTLQECRELAASLYYKSYKFPDSSRNDEYLLTCDKNVFTNKSDLKNDQCIQLLAEWDKKAGKDSTHVVIERRLRQMNKIELADWLGKTAFHQLASYINDTLLRNPFADSNEELALNFKLLEDKALLQVNDKLTLFDAVLRIAVIILFLMLIVVCCRIIHLSCVKTSVDNEKEELKKILMHTDNENES